MPENTPVKLSQASDTLSFKASQPNIAPIPANIATNGATATAAAPINGAAKIMPKPVIAPTTIVSQSGNRLLIMPLNISPITGPTFVEIQSAASWKAIINGPSSFIKFPKSPATSTSWEPPGPPSTSFVPPNNAVLRSN